MLCRKMIRNLLSVIFILWSGWGYAAPVKCLFSFYIQPGRFRGGRLVSDRTILYRSVRYFGRIRGFGGRTSGGYLVRFRFFRPVTPVAGRTDGGSAYIRIDGKREIPVPQSSKNFVNPGRGRVIEFFTAVKPKYVQLIVRGEGRVTKSGRTRKRYRDSFRYRRRLGVESAAAVGLAFRKAFRERRAQAVLKYFRKTRVFVRQMTGRRMVRAHQDGEQAAVLFSSRLRRAVSLDVKSGFRSVRIILKGARGGGSSWLVEKRGLEWRVTGCRLVPFGMPGRSWRRY